MCSLGCGETCGKILVKLGIALPGFYGPIFAGVLPAVINNISPKGFGPPLLDEFLVDQANTVTERILVDISPGVEPSEPV